MKRRDFVAGAALLAAPAIVQAQAVGNWPGTRPVRIIHPSQAGGPGDIYTRLLCEHFSRVFGGTFVTENRVGGTGTIGTAAVAQAAPDGWTLLMSSNTAHIVSPLVLPSVPYDPVRAFTAVAAIYRYGMMLIVSPKLPVKNTAEFVAWAKAGNREVNMASQGIGSVGHMMAERFHQRAGFRRVHVPYRGGPAGILAVSQGESDYIFDNIGNAGAMIRDGMLRGLSLTGRNRAPQMPEVPTLEEEGYPGFYETVWFGLYAPTGTPRAIIERLNAETNRWIESPAIQQRMAEGAHEPMVGTPEAMDAYWADERRLWAALVNETKATLN